MRKSLKVLVLAAALLSAFTSEKGYEVGSVVDGFSLKNVDGKLVNLKDYSEAKGAIVVFTCNTCPVAQAYEQRIADLDKKYAPKGYPVIAINPNDAGISPGDSFSEMQKRATAKQYGFPYLWDADQSVTRKFGATRTPHTYVLENEGGASTVRYIGAIDNNQNGVPDSRYVEAVVEALLAGQKPEVVFTKAVGCGIKFRKDD